jgi:enediyne biosynthesis protein E4
VNGERDLARGNGEPGIGGGRSIPRAATLAPFGAVVLILAALAAGLASPSDGTGTAGETPTFVDQTDGSGIDGFTYDGELEYQVGAGVAVLDCNDDARPDLYLAGGGTAGAGLFRNDSSPGGPVRFTRVRDAAAGLGAVTGAYPLDVDGDRKTDLAVLRIGGNVVLRGLGDCRFERANEAWSLDGGTFDTMAFSATWERGNAWPTLAYGNYVDQHIDDPERRCQPNVLVRPAGASALEWGEPELLTPAWCTLSMLFSSWDGSGRMDLRVSNDRHYYPQDAGQEQLWRMEPNQPPRLYGRDDGWSEVQVEGMGIASQDLTGDGLPEVYLTSQAANHLMTLGDDVSRPTYVDIGLERGTNVPHPVLGEDKAFPSTAWHPEFADVNNDGLVDLYVSKGNVYQQPDYARQDPSHLLMGQADGTFAEATEAAGLVSFDRGRGAALVDLDLDGRLDVVESFYRSPVRIWWNAGPANTVGAPGHWLGLRLLDTGPNADAVGAWIEVTTGTTTLRREVTIGGGHAGGQLGWMHFGLGPAEQVTVLVRWPDGSVTGPLDVKVDQRGTVDHSTGTFGPWGASS